MNEGPDFVQGFINWLLQDPDWRAPSATREEHSSGARLSEGLSVAPTISSQSPSLSDLWTMDGEMADLELLEATSMLECSASPEPIPFSPHSGRQKFVLGETITVHDRFHNLLKRRLQAEIQLRPPLFPWETEITDYESTESASLMVESVMPTRCWTAQLQNLNLPVPLPEKVLAQLLERCQGLVQSSLLEGAKIVQAVESLFPDQSQVLNQLAQVVMMSPARSGGPQLSEAVRQHLPPNYESANQKQQMLLSLLAAREIVGSLNLTVSAQRPLIERQWQTEVGPLLLEIQYQVTEKAALRAQVWLPAAGSLKFSAEAGGAAVVAQRPDSGYLSVELPEPQLQQRYLLAVQLVDLDQAPLIFSIQPVIE